MRLGRRFRGFVLGVGFYALAACAVGYFWWHAHHGDRGLLAKASYKIRIAELNTGIEQIRTEKLAWERRVALMRSDNLDRDILEERARVLLNSAHKNDVIVILPQKR